MKPGPSKGPERPLIRSRTSTTFSQREKARSFYIFEVPVVFMRVGARPVVWSAVACYRSGVRQLAGETRTGSELPAGKAAASCRTPNSVPSTSAPAAY
jgi:hypothetical protein